MDPEHVLTTAQDALTARRVFGEPIQADGVTILPVAIVGGGGGGGKSANSDAGVGFGLAARPAGVYVIANGDAKWRPAVNVNRIVMGGQLVAIAAIFALRPLISRWLKPAEGQQLPPAM